MNDKDPAIVAQRKKMQMEIMLKDSDIKKNQRALLDIEISLRDNRHKQAGLQSEFIVKESQFKRLTALQVQLQAEIIKLKHQMNNLGR
jgi:hypothetical protein